MRMRGVVWFQVRGWSESFQDLIDISWYGNIDVSKLVIPCQGESEVNCASDITCCCVFCLECVVKMVQVGMCRVLNTEIINGEGE